MDIDVEPVPLHRWRSARLSMRQIRMNATVIEHAASAWSDNAKYKNTNCRPALTHQWNIVLSQSRGKYWYCERVANQRSERDARFLQHGGGQSRINNAVIYGCRGDNRLVKFPREVISGQARACTSKNRFTDRRCARSSGGRPQCRQDGMLRLLEHVCTIVCRRAPAVYATTN